MRSRICSSCGQAKNRQQYSNNQWRRNPAVSRCSFCVGDDGLELPSHDRQAVRFQAQALLPNPAQQPSQKSNIRVGFVASRRTCKLTAELVENGAVLRKIGVWSLPASLSISSTRIKCLHVRKGGVSISNSHAMFAVALAGATRSESGVAVFKFDSRKYPKYIWFGHDAVRSQFYDNFIRVWGPGSKKFSDYSLSDWKRLKERRQPSTHFNSTLSANVIPDDAWALILTFLDINDLMSLYRVARFRDLVHARIALGRDSVYQANSHEMSSTAVFSSCARVYLSRVGYSISCFESETGREIASWSLPVVNRPNVRLEILDQGVALSRCMTYIAAVMEICPGDQNDDGLPDAFDNDGNPIIPETFGVSCFDIKQRGSPPFHVHEGQYRAVCFDGDDLLMFCDYSLHIAERQSGFRQSRTVLSLQDAEPMNGTYRFSSIKDRMIRITKDLTMDLDGSSRFVITRRRKNEICQVEPRLMSSHGCFKFFAESSELYADDAFEVGFSGESILRLRCREHEPEIWDLTSARLDGEGCKTLEITHHPAASDYLMSSSRDGIRIALLPRTSGRLHDDHFVDIDEMLRYGARFREQTDQTVDEEISSHDLSPNQYVVKIYEMMNGLCQRTFVLNEDETPKELHFLCNRRLLVRVAFADDTHHDNIRLLKLDCHCSCSYCC